MYLSFCCDFPCPAFVSSLPFFLCTHVFHLLISPCVFEPVFFPSSLSVHLFPHMSPVSPVFSVLLFSSMCSHLCSRGVFGLLLVLVFLFPCLLIWICAICWVSHGGLLRSAPFLKELLSVIRGSLDCKCRLFVYNLMEKTENITWPS